MNNYHWQGEIIKLTEKDYLKLERIFPDLSLEMELACMDMVFCDDRPKNWYMTMMYKLRFQQEKVNKQPQSTRERSIEQDLTDRSWADNVKQIRGWYDTTITYRNNNAFKPGYEYAPTNQSGQNTEYP